MNTEEERIKAIIRSLCRENVWIYQGMRYYVFSGPGWQSRLSVAVSLLRRIGLSPVHHPNINWCKLEVEA